MRFASLLLGCACVIDPLVVSGKPCAETCTDGFACIGGLCVPDGGHFCDVVTGAASCLDFDEGLNLDAGWHLERVPGWLHVDAQGELVSDTVDAGAESNARLAYTLPPWQHARLSFDLQPSLSIDDGFVAVAEIQCVPGFDGPWFHYVATAGGGAEFQLRIGNGPEAISVTPAPPMGAWSRISFDATLGSPNVAKISIDGSEVASTTFEVPDCLDAGWQANLGVSSQTASTAVQRVLIDNAVLDVTPL